MEKEGRKKGKRERKESNAPPSPQNFSLFALCDGERSILHNTSQSPAFAPAFVRSATCPLVLSTTSEYQGSDPISSSIQTRKCRGQRQETARMLQSVEHCQNGNIRGIFTQLSDKKKFRVRLLIRERPVAQGVLRPVARVKAA